MNTNTKIIKAIHIDPFAHTVTMIDVSNDFECMKADLMKCEYAETVNLGMGAIAWIDEEGTLKDWSTQGWCRIGGHQILAGQIIITGITSDGDMADTPEEVTADFVRGAVEFIDYKKVKLPGMSMTTFDTTGKPSTEHIGPKVRTHETG